MKKTQLSLDNSLRMIFKTSVIIFIGLFLSKIFSYIYRIVIARYLGAEIYGLFSLSIAIVGWFIAFASLGFVEGIIRYISFYRGKKDLKKISYLYKLSSTTLLISTIFMAILSFSLARLISINIFHEPGLTIFLQIFSILIPFWIFATYFLNILRSFEKVEQQSFVENIIQNFVKVAMLVLLILLGFKTNAVIFSFFAGIFAMFLAAFLYCKFKTPEIFKHTKLKSKSKKEVTRSFVSYSWPVMFFGIISSALYWIDSIVLGIFKSATEVGFYNAIIPIALLLNIAPGIFLQLLFPLITKEYSLKKFKVIKESTKQIGKWIFVINLPFFILMIIFPGAIINVLFGAEYVIGSIALRFLLIGALASSILIISHNILSMLGRSRIILFDVLIATILNIILNIWLVPKPLILGLDNSLGINGAAIATMISTLVLNLLFVIQAKHYMSIIPLRRKMVKILFISLIPLSFLLLVRKFIEIKILSAIIITIIFFLIYFALLLFFKAFDKNDLMILSGIKTKLKSITKL
ncbi:hypothetical protein CMI37_26180 [Candidatus Pacearchaeota archaeon]|nr:hypothetical protein [Candidatus Pacearchaeota archaeon]|tara:strand:+ start:8886 stop:10451 length:1566 start_codon:yes stop_codon:yes gene_type:complete